LPNTDENQFWLFGTVFGGKFYDPQTQQISADDPNLVRALEWFQSYAKKYGSKEIAAFQSGLSSERAQNLDPFIGGKLSMMVQGPWKLGDLKLFGDKLDYGVIAPPLSDSDAKPANWTHGDIQIIPKGCKDPAAAADFVFFTGGVNDPAGYAQRVTWGNRPINIPVSKTVLKEPTFHSVCLTAWLNAIVHEESSSFGNFQVAVSVTNSHSAFDRFTPSSRKISPEIRATS
jgi:hypothetical protein